MQATHIQCAKYQSPRMCAHLGENSCTCKNNSTQNPFFQKRSNENLCSASITLESNNQDQPSASFTDINKVMRCVINTTRLQVSGKSICLDNHGENSENILADQGLLQGSSLKLQRERLWRTAQWRKGTIERSLASNLQKSPSFIFLTYKLRLITFLSMHMSHGVAVQNKKNHNTWKAAKCYPYRQSSLRLHGDWFQGDLQILTLVVALFPYIK